MKKGRGVLYRISSTMLGGVLDATDGPYHPGEGGEKRYLDRAEDPYALRGKGGLGFTSSVDIGYGLKVGERGGKESSLRSSQKGMVSFSLHWIKKNHGVW